MRIRLEAQVRNGQVYRWFAHEIRAKGRNKGLATGVYGEGKTEEEAIAKLKTYLTDRQKERELSREVDA